MRDHGPIRRIQNSDISVLDEVITTHYDEIYRFLCRKLVDREAAQDVTQTVFVKFAAGLSRYDERGKLRNYLFKLASNAGNDWFREQVRTVPLDDLGDPPSDELGPQAMAEKRETADAVKHALYTLPGFQRDSIILRFYHDLSFKDIAWITGTNVSTAKSRYRQGMEKLKYLLKEEWPHAHE
jgi:RNA polymerase sigma-70 factor (ECF subfamily)